MTLRLIVYTQSLVSIVVFIESTSTQSRYKATTHAREE